MNNIKVRAKLTIVMIVSVLALAICTYLSIVNMNQLQTKALDVIEEDARSSYDEEIRHQVENVISLCQNIYDKYQAGEYTEQEAKKLAADEIRALRYGDNGYFWVISMMELMLSFWEVLQRGRTVWRQKTQMVIRW